MWDDDFSEEDEMLIGRIKAKAFLFLQRKKSRKKRKKVMKNLGRDKISYVPYICDYLWIADDGVSHESYRIYRDGRVCSLQDDNVFFLVSDELLNELIHRLDCDLIPYVGKIGSDPLYGDETWYLFFYDRNGEQVSLSGGCGPLEYDYMKVIKFIEEEILFPNIDSKRRINFECDE